MKNFFKQIKEFLNEIFKDPRIPLRDKKIILGICLMTIVRILFIPDWIPYFGILDLLFLMGIVLDYFFGIIDQSLLLSHYPWGMKSFARIRRFSLFIAFFAPGFIKDNLWEYTKDPF
ncbi:MAG: hypothetical protein Q7U04_01740 [Bacteriovorax sp.]|nr:hypothetical protein [Bacteriovorax sp.]